MKIGKMPIFAAREQIRTERFAHFRNRTVGTWQQLVPTDFDNRPGDREILFQLAGEQLAG